MHLNRMVKVRHEKTTVIKGLKKTHLRTSRMAVCALCQKNKHCENIYTPQNNQNHRLLAQKQM